MQPIIHKTGLSTCGKDISPELFDSFAAAGVTEVEIATASHKYYTLPHKAIAKWAKDAGCNLWSYHVPFGPFESNNIAFLDPSLRKGACRILADLIKRAGDIGIGRVVIHPSGEPNAPEDRAAAMEAAKESLCTLADVSEQAGCVLCVEDLPRTCLGNCAEDLLELTAADARLRVCFDTNHLLTQSIRDFICKVGHLIETVHFSDYDFRDERHWLPGEGRIDWVELMDLLDEHGYKGPILYELDYNAPRTIHRPRLLTPEDFARNKAELEARAPLTVIGTPAPQYR